MQRLINNLYFAHVCSRRFRNFSFQTVEKKNWTVYVLLKTNLASLYLTTFMYVNFLKAIVLKQSQTQATIHSQSRLSFLKIRNITALKTYINVAHYKPTGLK